MIKIIFEIAVYTNYINTSKIKTQIIESVKTTTLYDVVREQRRMGPLCLVFSQIEHTRLMKIRTKIQILL